jgi:hypothetical protein
MRGPALVQQPANDNGRRAREDATAVAFSLQSPSAYTSSLIGRPPLIIGVGRPVGSL